MSPPLPLITTAELSANATKKSCYVTLNNRKVYDVTRFINEHPGGSDLILDFAGRDITDIMGDLISHEHSDSAYEILDDYLIGILATPAEEEKLLTPGLNKDAYILTGVASEEDMSIKTDYDQDYKSHQFLDLNKPLFLQVLLGGFDRQFYLQQVHRPRHYGNGSAPLFGNFLEPLSKTPWFIVPLVWLPCIAYGCYLALQGLPAYKFALLFGLGLFLWTLVEYILHRMLFHLDDHLPNHSIAFSLHFILHGIHHYLPMDKLRLVMPPTLFVALATPFYKLAHALFPYYAALAVYSGGILGYVMYDVTHYLLHHAVLPPYFRDLKSYHMDHHYKNYELGFGVTSKFWDVVFGTQLVDTRPQAKSL
ncbi:hypothetical protein V1514DRAFT_173916 [Lipomyces japonicus]|uniref:uncharacterized protein n=1 Tax=Lipomyces japonicus TaxID=56871 RepID=UPI0034CD17A3